MFDISVVRNLLHSSLVKTTGIYTITKVISSSIPFLLLPVMTSYLSPEDYGVISMITTVVAFSAPFVTLNFDSAVVRRYYYKDGKISKYIGTCTEIIIVQCITVTLLFVLFCQFMSSFIKIPVYVVVLIPIYCILQFFKTIVLYNWQVKEQAVKYGIYSVTSTILEMSIAIALIVGLGFNWQGRALSLLISSVLLALYAVIYLKRNQMIKLTFSRQYGVHALKYGIGLIPHAVGASLMVLSNNFFLTNMVNIRETGLYGVASSLASILSFITLSFNNAYVPWLFDNLSKGDDVMKRKIVIITYIYILFILCLGVLGYFFIIIIFPIFVNDSFSEATKYIPWLIAGLFFQGVYFMMTNYILYSEKTYFNGIVTITAGVINLLFNYVLISIYGAIGAAMAFAFTYFLYFCLTWFVANKVYPMPWNLFSKRKNDYE